MATHFSSWQQNVNILFSDPNYSDFSTFSNHVWTPSGGDGTQPDGVGTYASLEDVHNAIHGEVGGNEGHMSDTEYAAFDPVFWLHHV